MRAEAWHTAPAAAQIAVAQDYSLLSKHECPHRSKVSAL